MYQSTKKIYIIATVEKQRETSTETQKSHLLYMCLKKCILCKNQGERRPSERGRTMATLYSVGEAEHKGVNGGGG